mmetsp:Transcript_29997/g.36558  ORF Transcript_29997/g.36558 Transcript_29997/m.36558 type:complete len:216 (+) Transcript_29997:94-741(+)
MRAIQHLLRTTKSTVIRTTPVTSPSTYVIRCKHKHQTPLLNQLTRTSVHRPFSSTNNGNIGSRNSDNYDSSSQSKTIKDETTGPEVEHEYISDNEEFVAKERASENTPRKERPDGFDESKYTQLVPVALPDIGGDGDGSSEGKVAKWHKSEGELIHRGDLICDIENKLFTFGMTSDDEGVTIMKEIMVSEGGEWLEPGTVIYTTLHLEDSDKTEE